MMMATVPALNDFGGTSPLRAAWLGRLTTASKLNVCVVAVSPTMKTEVVVGVENAEGSVSRPTSASPAALEDVGLSGSAESMEEGRAGIGGCVGEALLGNAAALVEAVNDGVATDAVGERAGEAKEVGARRPEALAKLGRSLPEMVLMTALVKTVVTGLEDGDEVNKVDEANESRVSLTVKALGAEEVEGNGDVVATVPSNVSACCPVDQRAYTRLESPRCSRQRLRSLRKWPKHSRPPRSRNLLVKLKRSRRQCCWRNLLSRLSLEAPQPPKVIRSRRLGGVRLLCQGRTAVPEGESSFSLQRS